ncbi:hypothetical protein [Sinomonas sp. P47F7]|uniref:hypothetical protein n=1 Tax=Sinomonas sp. P47F7 TaxID=3410987 RepID=UPI003BF52A80
MPWITTKQTATARAKARSPFTARHERTWPRAGVRRNPDGLWQLVVWFEPDVMSSVYAGVSFKHQGEAIALGATIAAAHRIERTIRRRA